MKWNPKRLFALIPALGLAVGLWLTAYAHDVPDLDRLGSITVTTRKADAPVQGGSLRLYRVGEVAEADGNYFFRLTGDFASCGESLEHLEAAGDLAARLYSFARQESLTGLAEKELGPEGTATFANLPVGLYLVTQPQAAAGYEPLAPFLVTLPYLDNGTYQYDLSALPKPELEQEPQPTVPPTTKPEPDPDLPLTGQLWWPVPVLACGGLLLFIVGLVLKRRPEDNES